jgi:hypothetical protein
VLTAKVDRFAAVFHAYVCAIGSVALGNDDERYRKILYFTVLEGLAKARYPNRGPDDAFSSFLVTYCGFSEGEKVSLPHLVGALERTSEAEFDDVRTFAFDALRKWGSIGPIGLERDPERAEVQRRWPKSTDGSSRKIPELGLDWPTLQHRNLLYAYRSKLSHESREQTMSFETPSDVRPYYESVHDDERPIDTQEIEWHLVYPSLFLAATCRTGIEALKVWLLAESVDPYHQFVFGHYLVGKLNDPGAPVRNPFRRRASS